MRAALCARLAALVVSCLVAGHSARARVAVGDALDAASRPVEVLAFQRSGSNLLRLIHNLTFATSRYVVRAHPGTVVHRYCLKCWNCTLFDRHTGRLLRGIVRNAPGQTHFRLDRPFFKPRSPYTRCHFPTLPSVSVHSLPDLQALYGVPMTWLVAVKEPVFWVISILHFWHISCPDMADESCLYLLRDWVSYYERWLELTANRSHATVGQSAVSIVRHEDILRDASGLLDGLGARYGWARRPRSERLNLDALKVPVSAKSNFHKKRYESEHRTFLLRPRLPGQHDDEMAWYRRNCPVLRDFFSRTDVPQRLGYDLWYLRECDPPGVPKWWRSMRDEWRWLLAVAVALCLGSWRLAARRRALATRDEGYVPLR